MHLYVVGLCLSSLPGCTPPEEGLPIYSPFPSCGNSSQGHSKSILNESLLINSKLERLQSNRCIKYCSEVSSPRAVLLVLLYWLQTHYMITAFLSADCLAWFTNYFSEFSVSNLKACCPDLWQSLWGCHRVQFSGQLFSVYINDVALTAGESLIHLYIDDTILYTSGPSFGHCVNKPPNELQCHTKVILLPPTTLKC